MDNAEVPWPSVVSFDAVKAARPLAAVVATGVTPASVTATIE